MDSDIHPLSVNRVFGWMIYMSMSIGAAKVQEPT
jgi:hypothetical protein